MPSSIRLFNLFGIPLKMHITFPLILLWGVFVFGFSATGFSATGALFGLIVTLLLFVIVVLHELGHSLAALYYDIPVQEIVMLPIGGVARISEIPEESSKELAIAAAGPAVNFAIAGLLYLLNAVGLVPLDLANPAEMLTNVENITVGNVLGYLWYTNLFLAAFNLIPAFPLDGGRILRAGLGTIMSFPRATQIAAFIGQGFAFLLGFLGFISGNLFLIIIAFFVYIGANQENSQAQRRNLLGDLEVAGAYSREVQTLDPQTPLRTAIEKTLTSFQQDFPVLEDGRLVGLLPYKGILQAASNQQPDVPVRQVMETDFQTASPYDELFDIQNRMMESQIEALPIVDGERLVGLLTLRDVREAMQLASTRRKAATAGQGPL